MRSGARPSVAHSESAFTASGSSTRYDRLEAEASEFHDRVRSAYLAVAEAEPGRFLVVDASLPVDEIAGVIRARVAGLL